MKRTLNVNLTEREKKVTYHDHIVVLLLSLKNPPFLHD